jgi:hypothetical protein
MFTDRAITSQANKCTFQARTPAALMNFRISMEKLPSARLQLSRRSRRSMLQNPNDSFPCTAKGNSALDAQLAELLPGRIVPSISSCPTETECDSRGPPTMPSGVVLPGDLAESSLIELEVLGNRSHLKMRKLRA